MLTYKVQYWDECKSAVQTAVGVVPTKEFTDAAALLNQFYGAKNIDRIELGYWEDSEYDVLELELSNDWDLIDLPSLPLEVLA